MENDQIGISAAACVALVQIYELLLGQCNKTRIHVMAQSACKSWVETA